MRQAIRRRTISFHDPDSHGLTTLNEPAGTSIDQPERDADAHDLLASSGNREKLLELITKEIEEATQDGNRLALLCIDIDHFKEINFSAGYAIGDQVLAEVSQRIQSVLRPWDIFARTGDDEFVAVLPAIFHEDHANLAAQKVQEKLSDHIQAGEHQLDVRISIGIALCPDTSTDAEELLRQATIALYEAKATQREYAIYQKGHAESAISTLSYQRELHQAILAGELLLYYQPKTDLATGKTLGVEALARWIHPEHGFIPPDEFIVVAERTGLINSLTSWALNTALRQAAPWEIDGEALSVSVNLSTRNLQDPELPELVERALETWRVEPQRLVLEITETAMMLDRNRTIEVLNRLSGLGLSLSIDDFGSGYSSLTYLQELPVNELKIDKEFVMTMHENDSNAAIVRTVIDLGHNFGLKVTAEGVEGAAAYDMLREMGCDMAQGYHIARPMKLQEFEELLGESDPV